MSVICSCKLGAFLSHLPPERELACHYQNRHDTNNTNSINNSRTEESQCNHNKEHGSQGCYQWQERLFAVYSPFMMDSQADRIKRESAVTDSGKDVKETSAQRKRRKKSGTKTVLSGSESKILDVICKALPTITEQAREHSYLGELQPSSGTLYNNNAARAASQIEGCGNLFQVLCYDFDDRREEHHHDLPDIVLDGDISSYRACAIIGRCVCNIEDHTRIIHVDNHQFIIPQLSSFLTSSFHHFVTEGYKQIQVKTGYDLIVIDPPWNNKSVKRKRSYHMVQEDDLKQIPVRGLAKRDSLLCVWITNNERLKNFVTDELFPHWSVDFIAEWIWMKVTRSGQAVCDLLSPHKKPYEQLIIGSFKRPVSIVPDTDLCDVGEIVSPSAPPLTYDGKEKSESLPVTSVDCSPGVNRTINEEETCIPKDFVLVSVPCSLHSKKPSLSASTSPASGLL